MISGDLILDDLGQGAHSRHITVNSPRFATNLSLPLPGLTEAGAKKTHTVTQSFYISLSILYTFLYSSISFYQFLYISNHFYTVLCHSISLYPIHHSISFYIILYHSMSFIVIHSHSISSYNSISFYCILPVIIQFYIILYHLSLYQVLSCIRPSLSFPIY